MHGKNNEKARVIFHLENNNFFLTQGPTGDNRNYIFSRKSRLSFKSKGRLKSRIMLISFLLPL